MNRSYRPPKNKKLPIVKLRQKRQYDFDDSEEQWDTFESPNVQFGSQNTTNESTICERSRSPGELDFPLHLSKKSLKYENFKPKLDSTHKEDCISSKAVEETSLDPMIENRSDSFLSTKKRLNSGIHGIHSECDSRKQYSQTRNSSINNTNQSNSKADQDLTLHYASGQSSEKMVAVQSVHQTQMRDSLYEAKCCDLQKYKRHSQCNSQTQFVQTRSTSKKVTDGNIDKSNSKVSLNVTPETISKRNSKKATQLVHTRDCMSKLQSENTDSFELHLDSNAVRPVKTPVFSRDVNVSRVKRILFEDSPDLLENFTSRSKSKKSSVPEFNIKAALTLPANNGVKLNIKRRPLQNVNKSENLVKKSNKILKNKEISVTNTLRSSFENAHCNGTSNPEHEILDLRKYRSGNGASIDIITLLHNGVIPESVKYIYYD